MILLEEVLVDVGVFVHADGDDGDLGEDLLHGEEAGQLVDAGGAPGGPEVEDDDVASELTEVDGAGGVGDDELRGWVADVTGVVSAVAAGDEKNCEEETFPNCAHDKLRFL